jgi:hypothetical protein
LLLLVAIKFSKARPKDDDVGQDSIMRLDATMTRKTRVCTEKRGDDQTRQREIAAESPMGNAPSETGSGADPLINEQLHGATIEHIEHARISRTAPGSVIAHEVVDAHAWPGGAGSGSGTS